MDNDLGISIEEKVHRIKAYLDETMTPEEEVEFQRWLDTSVANRVLLDRIRDERILLNKIRYYNVDWSCSLSSGRLPKRR